MRHNGRDSVSNHQLRDCLLNRLFRRRPKKTSKLRVTGLCAGNSFDDVIMYSTSDVPQQDVVVSNWQFNRSFSNEMGNLHAFLETIYSWLTVYTQHYIKSNTIMTCIKQTVFVFVFQSGVADAHLRCFTSSVLWGGRFLFRIDQIFQASSSTSVVYYHFIKWTRLTHFFKLQLRSTRVWKIGLIMDMEHACFFFMLSGKLHERSSFQKV